MWSVRCALPWCLILIPTFLSSLHRAYEQLNVKHEPLQLIQPQFETPLPALQPAVSRCAWSIWLQSLDVCPSLASWPLVQQASSWGHVCLALNMQRPSLLVFYKYFHLMWFSTEESRAWTSLAAKHFPSCWVEVICENFWVKKRKSFVLERFTAQFL